MPLLRPRRTVECLALRLIAHTSTPRTANLKQEVAQLTQRVNTAIGEDSLSPAQQAISANVRSTEFWKQFIQWNCQPVSFQDIQGKFATLRDHCFDLR